MRRFDSKSMRMVDDNAAPRRRKRADEEIYDGDIGQGVSHDSDLAAVVADLSVAEVIELIESGEADLDSVIAAEKVGKARKTVLHLVQGESGKVYPVSKTDRDHSVTDSNKNPFA